MNTEQAVELDNLMVKMPNPFPKVELSNNTVSPQVDARASALQARLNAAGVRNIHFSWNYEAMAKNRPSIDEVLTSVCQIMEDVLDGKTTKVPMIDESMSPQLPDHIKEIIRNTSIA